MSHIEFDAIVTRLDTIISLLTPKPTAAKKAGTRMITAAEAASRLALNLDTFRRSYMHRPAPARHARPDSDRGELESE